MEKNIVVVERTIEHVKSVWRCNVFTTEFLLEEEKIILKLIDRLWVVTLIGVICNIQKYRFF